MTLIWVLIQSNINKELVVSNLSFNRYDFYNIDYRFR